jgi:hypothetical protein
MKAGGLFMRAPPVTNATLLFSRTVILRYLLKS